MWYSHRLMEYRKVKSAAKVVLTRGKVLESVILKTAKDIATIVGGTLGPQGRPVLIERPEHGLPPIITKDGVTVFRALGYQDPVAHCLCEAMRDASVRTASEAGDGTTTATVLAEAFIRLTQQFCSDNLGISPQSVVRDIQHTLSTVLLPEIERLSLKGDLESEDGRRRLRAVAKISGNGDEELADAVMQCYDICGDEGNVNIVEGSGPVSKYEVERIDGFPIPMGFEESIPRFFPVFINKAETQQILVDKPLFLLYFGRINEIQTIVPVLEMIQEAFSPTERGATPTLTTPNVVLVASGFSEAVLASLARNWAEPGSINILPLCAPNHSPVHNAVRNFLDDLAAVTGATVFDPLTRPLDTLQGFDDIGNVGFDDTDHKWKPMGVTSIEVGRFRSTVLGHCDDDILLARAEQVKGMAEQAESELEAGILRERLAKLSGGIARLKVIGGSNGEVKERRDRADDAICAVRGALKHGCLPGGTWMLKRLTAILYKTPINTKIVIPALDRPTEVLLENAGVDTDHSDVIKAKLLGSAARGDVANAEVWNAATGKFVKADEAGLLDSTPAVRDALKNAISIATLKGTLGGVIVQPRDISMERSEAGASAEFDRYINHNPADERA